MFHLPIYVGEASLTIGCIRTLIQSTWNRRKYLGCPTGMGMERLSRKPVGAYIREIGSLYCVSISIYTLNSSTGLVTSWHELLSSITIIFAECRSLNNCEIHGQSPFRTHWWDSRSAQSYVPQEYGLCLILEKTTIQAEDPALDLGSPNSITIPAPHCWSVA